jgi:hypothetical protein
MNSPPESSVAVTTTNKLIPADSNLSVVRQDSNVSTEEFFHEKVGELNQPRVVEKSNSDLKDETSAVLTCALEAEIQELKDQIEQEKLKVEEQKQSKEKLSKEKEQQLQRTNKLLENLKQQLLNRLSQEQQLKDLMKQIKAIDYDKVQSIIVNVFLYGKQKHIINHLKTKQKMENHFIGIPSMTITENNDLYRISITGVQAHHDEFKLVLRRIQTLSNVTQSAKDYYQRQLNNTFKSIHFIMTQKIRSSQDWKHYTKYFQQLVKNKIEEFVKLNDEHISQKAKAMIEQCITDPSFQSWVELRKITNAYMKIKLFEPELEILKYEALDEYIKQHVLLQQLKFDKKPSVKSLQTMNEFIEKVKKEFKTNPIYVGCQFKQFKEIPKLLQRIMLYYRCFLLQLPLYESSKELLDKIEKNTVITIATSTGSGKQ